jgi:hypothetical protein
MTSKNLKAYSIKNQKEISNNDISFLGGATPLPGVSPLLMQIYNHFSIIVHFTVKNSCNS